MERNCGGEIMLEKDFLVLREICSSYSVILFIFYLFFRSHTRVLYAEVKTRRFRITVSDCG